MSEENQTIEKEEQRETPSRSVAEYIKRYIFLVVGLAIMSFGVAFEMSAGVLTLAGEGLVQALCTVLPKVKFGYMKVMVDVSFVVIAVVLSFIFLHELQGVREGTVAAAIFVGLIAKFLNRFISPVANKLFADGKRLKLSHGNT